MRVRTVVQTHCAREFECWIGDHSVAKVLTNIRHLNKRRYVEVMIDAIELLVHFPTLDEAVVAERMRERLKQEASKLGVIDLKMSVEENLDIRLSFQVLEDESHESEVTVLGFDTWVTNTVSAIQLVLGSYVAEKGALRR